MRVFFKVQLTVPTEIAYFCPIFLCEIHVWRSTSSLHFGTNRVVMVRFCFSFPNFRKYRRCGRCLPAFCTQVFISTPFYRSVWRRMFCRFRGARNGNCQRASAPGPTLRRPCRWLLHLHTGNAHGGNCMRQSILRAINNLPNENDI